jgi:ABC-type uncharacterized transport system permease subunit
MIVTLTPTILDGVVLRWYENETDRKPVMSVSRNRIEVYADEVDPVARENATAAFRELARNSTADVRHYATHVRTRHGLTPIGDVTR